MVVSGLSKAHKSLVYIVLGVCSLAFVTGFLFAGFKTDTPEARKYSEGAVTALRISQDRNELVGALMQYGHWEAELAEQASEEQITLENFHQYLALVGIYETDGIQQALFIVDASPDWRESLDVQQIKVTADGRVRAQVGDQIAPNLELESINNSSVDLLVKGELSTKYLYNPSEQLNTVD